MGRPRRVNCRVCDRHIDAVGPLSARGKCETCSVELMTDAVNQVIAGRGPVYERYVSGLTRATERAQDRLVDRNSR